jgi:hypothetical protein
MNKYLFLIATSIIALPLFCINNANAIPVTIVGDSATAPAINERLDQENEENMEDRQLASEQASNDAAIQTKQQGHFADGRAFQEVEKAHGQAMSGTHNKYLQADEYPCSFPSVSQSMSAAKESAEQEFEAQLKKRLEVISGQSGSRSENGLVKFQEDLFDESQSAGQDSFSIGEILLSKTIPTSGTVDKKLEYAQNLLYARVPVYLDQQFLDNPDPETKNIATVADRLRAEMAIGQSVFSMLKANRASNKGNGRAIQFQREIMENNGFSGQYLQKLLTSDASYRAQLEAMIVGQFGKDYMQEKLITNPENYGSGILWNMMLNNLIQFENYRLLEAIAMATSTNVIAVREKAITDVNARIARKNARQ